MWDVYFFLHLCPVFSRVEALKISDIEKTDCSMFRKARNQRHECHIRAAFFMVGHGAGSASFKVTRFLTRRVLI